MDIHLQSGGTQAGPYSEKEVRAMVTSGRVMRADLAWREGMTEWLPLEQVVTLPPRPSPPPVPKAQPVLPANLPPLPAGLPPVSRRAPARPQPSLPAVPTPSSTTIRTVGGVIALLLGLLAVFNIGGCVNARAKLTRFQRGDNTLDGVNMLVDTARGINEGDPLRGVSGLLDKAQSLQEDYEGFQLGAWLCVAGTAVAGGVSWFSTRPKAL